MERGQREGIFDAPTRVIDGGMVLTNDYTLTVKTSDFGAALYGDSITVNGVAYKVRETRQMDDGALSEISLQKV